ncbi:MAG: ribosome silencing factor [Commensalibacter sp.]|nr:ribosome silencing factor [Commensalibacter sp.]
MQEIQAGPQNQVAHKTNHDEQRINHLVSVIVNSLEDDKAEDIVVIDLKGKASFADQMIIATGLVDRQIAAMAENLDKALFKEGIKKIAIEGSSDWVLLDIGDIIVHLFRQEVREHYNIERIWGVQLEEESTETV